MKHNNELLKHIYKDASMATYTITTLLEDLKDKNNKIKKQEKQRKTKEKGDCYGRRKRTDFKAREKDYRPYSVQAWYGEAHGKRSGILGTGRGPDR